MIGFGKLKRKIILRIIVLLLPVLFICAFIGIIVLLAKLEIIPSASAASSNMGNISVGVSAEVSDLLAMSEEEVWRGLTGGLLSARPTETSPSNAAQIEAAVRSQIVTIEVPVRKWANSGSMDRVETTQTIEVNKFLEKLWLEFFTKVFENAPDFVFASLGCFRIDGTGYGQIGYRSGHTYGAAVDINWYEDGNPYGQQPPVTKEEWEKMEENHLKYQTIYVDSPIVQIAHQYTLLWGGEWRNSTKDLMHFSFVCDGRSREERLQLIK